MKILQGKQKEMLSVYYQQISIYLKAKACKIFQEVFTLFFLQRNPDLFNSHLHVIKPYNQQMILSIFQI